MKITAINLKIWAVTAIVVVGLGTVGFSAKRSPVTGTPADGAVATYKAKCTACHGADGGGNTPAGKKLGARDLGSAAVQGQSDAQLLNIISKGKGKMPGYEKTLGGDTSSQLVKVVRSFKK